MKKLTIIITVIALLPVLAWASNYNYISQENMRSRLDTKDQVTIVDICPIEQFAKGHLPGSIETNAYPVKTSEEKAKLQPTLSIIQASSNDVVIVCPGGRGGAKRTYDYYKANGIDESRLLILEKGMNDWPYQTESN